MLGDGDASKAVRGWPGIPDGTDGKGCSSSLLLSDRARLICADGSNILEGRSGVSVEGLSGSFRVDLRGKTVSLEMISVDMTVCLDDGFHNL